MPLVKFINADNEIYEVNAEIGGNLMQVALDNGIDEILGECGGSCSCATCHCYIGDDWLAKTGTPDDTEQEMLECALAQKVNSRLSCQIKITEDLDGLIVHLPEAQY
ncbi:2Fe-2S iron-sulfur cluster-binding protein [Zhongshania marina]|uniref:(2Fe-2S)-binding protein n=1 Tax=Zhongshania marina TaxID=2304603 RepID=A0ABX9W4N8_9GAMM|nr:(2Fe-2S)-binding protein [Zhongshania marina]